MDIDFFLSIVTSWFFLFFFIVYNKDIIRGKIKPNIVTRSLFSLITLINSISYLYLTQDILKSILLLTDCLACVVVTCFLIYKYGFTRPNKFEFIIIVLSGLALLVGYILKSPLYINLLLQPIYILAFLPTYKNVWNKPQDENVAIWFARALCFLINIGVVLLRGMDSWIDLVCLGIAFFLHIGLAIFIVMRKNRLNINHKVL